MLIITKQNKDRAFTICNTVTSPPAGGGANVDCTSKVFICSNATLSGTSNGFGTQELNAGNQGCISFGGEKESAWYTFTVQTSGTFDMAISPQNGTDDYDFALWGPNPTCPPSSTPIRCSFAGGGGNTGIGNGANDTSEGAGGDKWVKEMNVTAGETYILLINNFSSTTSPFNLSFSGTASLNCSQLGVKLKSFEVDPTMQANELKWITGSERNSDYFVLENSTDGMVFNKTVLIQAVGNSDTDKFYSYTQQNPDKTINLPPHRIRYRWCSNLFPNNFNQQCNGDTPCKNLQSLWSRS